MKSQLYSQRSKRVRRYFLLNMKTYYRLHGVSIITNFLSFDLFGSFCNIIICTSSSFDSNWVKHRVVP